MKLATFATHALAATGLWSLALAAKTANKKKDEARLVKLANAISVLRNAGMDVSDLGWGKKPEPEEQLFGSELSVGVAGVDLESLSGPELAFLENAVKFSFNQVNNGGDGQVMTVRIFSQENGSGGDDASGNSTATTVSSASSLGRRSPTWTFWHTSYNMRCRMCRDERLLGAQSGVEGSSPLVEAWENKLEHVLQTSGFEAFAGVFDVDILVGSGEIPALAASTEAAVASA
jgi:hypothetical protein